MNVKPEFDTTAMESRAAAFERPAFDKASLRRDGVQVIKDFFEPEMKARFQALGERVIAGLESGELGRSFQFALGVDLNTEAKPSDSAALTAVAEEMFGKDIGQFYMRLVMKDAKFRTPIEIHQDYPYFGGDTNKLNVFIPITHCGADNGMVKYYVGSHKMGPVERGDIDIVRYPQFEGVIPELEVGDVLLADFLTWHGSHESDTGEPRIMIQIVLQPLSDPSSSFQFGQPPEDWGPQLMPRKWIPMRTARPSIGILTVKEMIGYPAVDEAARMLRGLCFDSPMNVEARLLLAEIITKQGHQGDNLLHGLAINGHVSDLLATAEEGLIQLAREVDKALGRPSRLTVELTQDVGAQLAASKTAEGLLERDLKDARNELTESAAELWKTREALKAAETRLANPEPSAEARAELDRSQAELAKTQAELAEARAALAQSQDTLASVMDSASWKLTGPLRGMISSVKKR